MLKSYEAVFILTPVLSEDQMKDTVAKFKSVLLDNGAKVAHEENWGLKKLAYPIQNKKTGFYQLFEFQASPDTVKVLETAFNREEAVLRHITVSLDKYALEYAEKRRKGFPSKTKKEVA